MYRHRQAMLSALRPAIARTVELPGEAAARNQRGCDCSPQRREGFGRARGECEARISEFDSAPFRFLEFRAARIEPRILWQIGACAQPLDRSRLGIDRDDRPLAPQQFDRVAPVAAAEIDRAPDLPKDARLDAR